MSRRSERKASKVSVSLLCDKFFSVHPSQVQGHFSTRPCDLALPERSSLLACTVEYGAARTRAFAFEKGDEVVNATEIQSYLGERYSAYLEELPSEDWAQGYQQFCERTRNIAGAP